MIHFRLFYACAGWDALLGTTKTLSLPLLPLLPLLPNTHTIPPLQYSSGRQHFRSETTRDSFLIERDWTTFRSHL